MPGLKPTFTTEPYVCIHVETGYNTELLARLREFANSESVDARTTGGYSRSGTFDAYVPAAGAEILIKWLREQGVIDQT